MHYKSPARGRHPLGGGRAATPRITAELSLLVAKASLLAAVDGLARHARCPTTGGGSCGELEDGVLPLHQGQLQHGHWPERKGAFGHRCLCRGHAAVWHSCLPHHRPATDIHPSWLQRRKSSGWHHWSSCRSTLKVPTSSNRETNSSRGPSSLPRPVLWAEVGAHTCLRFPWSVMQSPLAYGLFFCGLTSPARCSLLPITGSTPRTNPGHGPGQCYRHWPLAKQLRHLQRCCATVMCTKK